MAKTLYQLKHPLYPHPDLIAHYIQHNSTYVSPPSSYDSSYKWWYQLVRADHDVSGAPIREIYREVTSIKRIKIGGKEYVEIGEYLIGEDHQHVKQNFYHQYGSYLKPGFRTVYNYETKQASTILTGQNETIYFIPYTKKAIEDAYESGSESVDVELKVQVGPRKYGGRGFFSFEEFRDLSIEELARMGATGKGMYKQIDTKIPMNVLASESRALGKVPLDQALIQEFEEFTRWKKMKNLEQQVSNNKK